MKASWLIIGALATSASLPLAAQDARALSDPEVELLAEMWAMGGICSQFANYQVSADRLGDFLNSQLSGVAGEARTAVVELRNAKMQGLEADAAAVQEIPRGSRRLRSVDEHAAGLMTRCRRLADNPLAGRYFGLR